MLAHLKRMEMLAHLKRREKDDHTWEVARKDVTLGAELGQGNFGTVYKGTLRQVTCHNTEKLICCLLSRVDVQCRVLPSL